MKNKKLFFLILVLTLCFSMIACSKSGGSGTTSNAQSNFQGDSSRTIEAQAHYEPNIQAEIERLSSDMQAGKISAEEYIRLSTDLMRKMTETEESLPSQSNSGNVQSGSGSDSKNASGILTINGLPRHDYAKVLVFTSGTDVSVYKNMVDALDNLNLIQASGETENKKDFPLFSGAFGFGEVWKHSGSLPVYMTCQSQGESKFCWATVNFSNGNATVNYNDFLLLSGSEWKPPEGNYNQ